MKIRPMIHRRQTMQAAFSPIFIQSYTWNRCDPLGILLLEKKLHSRIIFLFLKQD
uniref:Uncharacterized protein n=1 Tax=Triticum urartu TaxID=4572 RepID=A0A8R7TMR5_TRIUA